MEWNGYNNSTRGPQVKAACVAHGLLYGIWLTRDFSADAAHQACVVAEPEFFIAEAEIPGHVPYAQDWSALVSALSDLHIPKAVVTNFAPFVHSDGSPDPAKAQPLLNDGWACLTECYDIGGDPATWPERRDFFAHKIGWPETQPVLGLYGGRTWESFPTWKNYRGVSVWAAEYII